VQRESFILQVSLNFIQQNTPKIFTNLPQKYSVKYLKFIQQLEKVRIIRYLCEKYQAWNTIPE